MTTANRAILLLLILQPLLTFLLGPAASSGQSLGEVARQCQKERETWAKKGQAPARVFTNDDIARVPPITILNPSNPASSSPETKPSTSLPKASAGAAQGSAGNTKEHWQALFKAARTRLAHAQEEETLVSDELRLLEIQQARELDPGRSRKLNGQAGAATVELQAKRAATEQARQAMDELKKEFQDSGAPPDWIQKQPVPAP